MIRSSEKVGGVVSFDNGNAFQSLENRKINTQCKPFYYYYLSAAVHTGGVQQRGHPIDLLPRA